MRNIFVLISMFLLPRLITAQSELEIYNRLITEARIQADSGQYDKAIAKLQSAKTIMQNGNTSKADQEIIRVFERVNQERKHAIENEKIAKAQRKIAEEATIIAQQKTNEAEEERSKTKQALIELERSVQKVTTYLLRDASLDILELRYDEAWTKLAIAAETQQFKTQVADSLMEVAFFYCESGQNAQATRAMALAAKLVGQSFPGLQQDNLAILGTATLRSIFSALNPDRYKYLRHRYYGQMVPIEGGRFRYKLAWKDSAMIQSFQMAQTETTNWQYGLFCAANNRTIENKVDKAWGFQGNEPVMRITWLDAAEYANWLSEKHGLKKVYTIYSDGKNTPEVYVDWLANGYRIPTDAEWLYAARGGNIGPEYQFAGSENPKEVAWYKKNTTRTRPVAGKKGNPLGLYDMSGNVAEICWYMDYYGAFPLSSILASKNEFISAGIAVSGTRKEGFWVRGGSFNAALESEIAVDYSSVGNEYKLGRLTIGEIPNASYKTDENNIYGLRLARNN